MAHPFVSMETNGCALQQTSIVSLASVYIEIQVELIQTTDADAPPVARQHRRFSKCMRTLSLNPRGKLSEMSANCSPRDYSNITWVCTFAWLATAANIPSISFANYPVCFPSTDLLTRAVTLYTV